jgi:DNA-binding NtrC family response regulator
LVSATASASARRFNRPVPRVTRAALDQLKAHDWPGNVRELQNVVERAVILSEGGPIRFYIEPSVSLRIDERAVAAPDSSLPPNLLTREQLKRLERESIEQALKQANGRVFGPNGAAEMLGMKATTLTSRIAALGLKEKKSR